MSIGWMHWAKQAFLSVAALLFFIVLFGPIYWMISTSVMTEAEMLAVPPHFFPQEPTFRNYLTVLGMGDPDYLAYSVNRAPAVLEIGSGLVNSLVIALSVAAINLVIAIPAAYAFARISFTGSGTLMFSFLATRMVPSMMLVVPMFLLLRSFGLLNTKLGLILCYFIFTVPFSIWLLQSYFRSLPVELEEAAMVDGCNRFQAVCRILLPVSIPGLTCVAILAFMTAWSEFLFAVTFGRSADSKTLPVIAASFSDANSVQFDFIMTAGVLTALPPFILALIFQRWIVGGLATGSVKG